METATRTCANLARFFGGGVSEYMNMPIDELAYWLQEAININEAENKQINKGQ